jgi:hypothetical protein
MKIDFCQFKDLRRKRFPGSLDPSEVYSFIYLIKKNKIEVVIESGRQYGYSTYFIGKFCKKNNIDFVSIDFNLDKKICRQSKKILSKINIKYVDGNFFFFIKKILDRYKHKKIALLVDGPKGLSAHSYCYNLLLYLKNLKFVFFDNILKTSTNLFEGFLFKKLNNFQDLRFPLNIRNKLIFQNNKDRIKDTSKDNDFGFIFRRDLNLSIFSIFFCKLFVFFYFLRLEANSIRKFFLIRSNKF